MLENKKQQSESLYLFHAPKSFYYIFYIFLKIEEFLKVLGRLGFLVHVLDTAQKVSVFGVFLVRIFTHSD